MWIFYVWIAQLCNLPIFTPQKWIFFCWYDHAELLLHFVSRLGFVQRAVYKLQGSGCPEQSMTNQSHKYCLRQPNPPITVAKTTVLTNQSRILHQSPNQLKLAWDWPTNRNLTKELEQTNRKYKQPEGLKLKETGQCIPSRSRQQEPKSTDQGQDVSHDPLLTDHRS